MNKFLKLMAIVAALVVVVSAAPVMAETYASNGIDYSAGVYTNDELVVSVTNGSVLGLTAKNIVLVPIGGANDTTNTITVRSPFQKLGTVNIRVAAGATNLVKIATIAASLNLGSDWIADAGGALMLNVSTASFASRVNGGQATPVLTLSPAAITATSAITKQTQAVPLTYTLQTVNVTNVAGTVSACVTGLVVATTSAAMTNATAAVTVVNGGVVLTNVTVALP